MNDNLLVHLVDDKGKDWPGIPVAFTSRRGFIEKQASTNANGVARAKWRGNDNGPDTIDVNVSTAGLAGHQLLVVTYEKPLTTEPVIPFRSGQHWYAGRQLVHATGVELPSRTSADCGTAQVAFKTFGDGAVSPDTARGEWIVADEKCRATTRWKLGTTTGEQSVRATLVDSKSPPTRISATARVTPYILAGLAFTHMRRYSTAASAPDTFHVVTKTPTTETSHDSVFNGISVEDKAAGFTFAPTIGVNTPLLTSVDWLRVSLSADARNPTTDWYAGISLLQPRSVSIEDIGLDIQFVIQASRRKVPDGACSSTSCPTRMDMIYSPGVMVQANSTSLLSVLTGVFK